MPSNSPIRFAVLAIVSMAIVLFPIARHTSFSLFPHPAPSAHVEGNSMPMGGPSHGKTGKGTTLHRTHHTVDDAHAFALTAASVLPPRQSVVYRSAAIATTFQSLPPSGPDHPPKHVSPLA